MRMEGIRREEHGSPLLGFEHNNIVALNECRVPKKEIAAQIGVSVSTVCNHTPSKKKGPKRKTANIPDWKREKIFELREKEKKTHRKIAEELGLKRSTVTYYLIKAGKKSREKPRPQISETKRRIIERLKLEHATWDTIAEASGVSRITVGRYLKKAGIIKVYRRRNRAKK
jgi:IS30 family transposase